MYIKRILIAALAMLLCFAWGCGDADTGETVPVQNDIITLMGDYGELYAAYTASPVDVTVTLSVDMAYSFENIFTITEGGDGYTLTELSSGEQYVYDAAEQAEAYKAAGYLPPNEVAYPDGEVYSSRLSGDLALERLLSGSNLFDGYDSGCVALDGECLFTARAEGGITSYTYEFKVNVTDGDVVFPATVKYLIEVNK